MKKIIYVLIAVVALFVLVKLVTPIFIKDNFEENAEQATENWKNESVTKIKVENDISIDEYIIVEEAVQADDYVEYKIIN